MPADKKVTACLLLDKTVTLKQFNGRYQGATTFCVLAYSPSVLLGANISLNLEAESVVLASKV
jgi:hypothetical protein